MRKLLLVTAVLALGACQKAETPPAEEAAPSEATAAQASAGTFEVVNPDGTKGTSVLKEDGTYEDKDEAGKVIETGKWQVTDGKSCFDPDDDKATVCFTDSAVAADGTFTATNEKGESITVKKVS